MPFLQHILPVEEIIILSSNLLFITDPEDKIRIQILKLSWV